MARRSSALSRHGLWTSAAVWAAILVWAGVASAHPLHSEAIARSCEIRQNIDQAPLVTGRCSFFVAADYLIFELTPVSDDEGAQVRSFSGTLHLTQASGHLFDSDGAELANGSVTLSNPSPQVIHMDPGALAVWESGLALVVEGSPVAAEGSMPSVAQETGETIFEVFENYLELGFVHIVPRGFDHILFVIGLFLLSPRLKALLWQVSAFTLAHTITLALGASGLVRLPAEVVEPLIALSILWVAVENLLTNRLHRWRIGVIFGFGLLHGFGFAGVLLEIGLSGANFYSALLAFNLGVELGQLAVIALCFLAVGWAMKTPTYHGRIVVPCSSVIALIAVFWTLERTVLA